MRVLVTGGTGAFGTAVCRQLARAGADPVAMARHEPARRPAGVGFVAGDVRDAAAVERAVDGCDAVVHLAWFMGVGGSPAGIRAINVGGTTTLLDAMERVGCRRLVFTSSTTAYGSSQHHPAPFRESEPLRPSPTFLYAAQKHEVEQLVAARDLDAVVARVTVVLGRQVDNDASQAYDGPALLDIGGRSVVQAVHQDDVGRFLEHAALGSWRGTVNLSAPGAVPMARAGELLDRRVARVPLGVSMRLGAAINRLGVHGIDADVARVLAFWPVVDTTELTERWGFVPVWGQEDILRDQARSASRFTHLAPGTRRIPRPRRLPWAATLPPDPAAVRPGAAWRHAAPEGVRGSLDTMIDPADPVYRRARLHDGLPGPLTPLCLELARHGMDAAADGLAQLVGAEGEAAGVLRLGAASFGHRIYVSRSSARLVADLVSGAIVGGVDPRRLAGASPAPRRRPTAGSVVAFVRLGRRVVTRLAGFHAEVDRLVGDAVAVSGVDAGALDDPALAAHLSLVHDLVAQASSTGASGAFLRAGLASARGHRGPGEIELAGDVLADRPELLVDVAQRAVAEPPGGDTERAWDAAARLVEAFRVATRERGRRLAAAGLLGAADDVLFLTYDELLSRTPPGASVVGARRAERDRLAGYRMPFLVDGWWAPDAGAGDAGTAEAPGAG